MLTYIFFSIFGVLAFGSLFGGSSSATPEAADDGKGTPEPADPKPDPVDPDPIPVDPNPVDPGPTDPDPVDPDPTPVDPDPTPVDPDPTPVDPDPTPVDPDPTPVDPVNPNPTPPVQQTDTSNGGSVAPTTLENGISVAGGRVTTLNLENADNIESVQIINGPGAGNLTVNPDNTLALVMSGQPGFSGTVNFSYEVTYADGTSETISNSVGVSPTTQAAGWGAGDFYMLDTDSAGDLIIETGDNSREVYISGSNNALSLSDIATLEGLDISQITDTWLAANPGYGGSEGMALDTEAGMLLWDGVTGSGSTPSSNWLLFENGYDYDANLFSDGVEGEDPLHPIHITSYGEGERAIINLRPFAIGESLQNVVFSNLKFADGFTALDSSNVILDNVEITDDNETALIVQSLSGVSENFTIRDSAIVDAYYTSPPDGSGSWAANPYMAGAYIDSTDGVLIEGNLFDHNGWAPDYREDLSAEGGQPPQMFNHNLYLQWNTTDVTLRDNIIMQGASFGAQARGGAFIEDNLFLDNNIGVTFVGGDHNGHGPVGNFSLVTDNVITSAGNRSGDPAAEGAVASGIRANNGEQSTMIDNIIAHLADPNNPVEQAEKEYSTGALHNNKTPFYDDTIVHNWIGSAPDSDQNETGVNTDNLDTSVLDATTIQIFTQQLLGDPNATIADLAIFLRAQANGTLDNYVDADLIIDFFQVGFGLSVEDRVTSETLRFVPDDLGDGIRWDNRMNWTTDDLPGSIAGDSVDLGGNWVNYGGTTTIENLDFGSGGELTVGYGRLTVEGNTQAGENGASLNIFNAGQVWMNGYADTDLLEIDVAGGRFVNTGFMDGNTTLTISDGQSVLASDGATYDIGAGSSISVDGSGASVGFDGALGDTGVLRLEEGGTLSFSADSEGFATIEEFRTGAMGDNPNIASGVNLGLGSLEIDITALNGSAGTYDLIAVDEMIGELSDINLIGLAGNQDAHLVIDYTTDTLSVQLTAPGQGNGSITLATEGEETDMDSADAAALWEALTAGHDTLSDDLATQLYLDDVYADEMVA